MLEQRFETCLIPNSELLILMLCGFPSCQNGYVFPLYEMISSLTYWGMLNATFTLRIRVTLSLVILVFMHPKLINAFRNHNFNSGLQSYAVPGPLQSPVHSNEAWKVASGNKLTFILTDIKTRYIRIKSIKISSTDDQLAKGHGIWFQMH